MKIEDIVKMADKYRPTILETERIVWKTPEPGYREWKTSEYMAAKFKEFGYRIIKAGNIPGFYAEADTGRKGPCVCVLAEMDSLIVPEHPECDSETGAVHACGHNAQCASVVGAAAVFSNAEALAGLCGKIRFVIVPAEEMIELEYRRKLLEEGTVKFFTGKPEFMSRGFFDGVDMAFMGHASSKPQKSSVEVYPGNNGCITKTVIYTGKSAHAGGAPQNGINALNSALLGLQAVNSIRETFNEKNYIRVNAVIKSGGAACNAIPDYAVSEIMVRCADTESLEKINRKINRALACGAAAVGAGITIDDVMTYSPLINSKELNLLVGKCADDLSEIKDVIFNDEWDTGSSDVGSLSAVMPVCHFYSGGSSGGTHCKDFCITHPEELCVNTAKLYSAIITRLLSDNGGLAEVIKSEYKPEFESISDYLIYLDKCSSRFNAVKYNDDGSVKILQSAE
ncbi:amidohydrolase [Lachnospiraceae bacterium NSJ-143]|nr:amidohydrolase [Lachnospiraceae bacterium NSJ-143]